MRQGGRRKSLALGHQESPSGIAGQTISQSLSPAAVRCQRNQRRVVPYRALIGSTSNPLGQVGTPISTNSSGRNSFRRLQRLHHRAALGKHIREIADALAAVGEAYPQAMTIERQDAIRQPWAIHSSASGPATFSKGRCAQVARANYPAIRRFAPEPIAVPSASRSEAVRPQWSPRSESRMMAIRPAIASHENACGSMVVIVHLDHDAVKPSDGRHGLPSPCHARLDPRIHHFRKMDCRVKARQ